MIPRAAVVWVDAAGFPDESIVRRDRPRRALPSHYRLWAAFRGLVYLLILSVAVPLIPRTTTEDWGWYVDVEAEGAHYMIGAGADAESSARDIEWILQIHKHRTLKEKILGQNKMVADDPLVALIVRIVRGDPQIAEVSVERDT